ncbi:MAG: hypothetical protein R3A10_15305 [Caldilineaceae bacterium]
MSLTQVMMMSLWAATSAGLLRLRRRRHQHGSMRDAVQFQARTGNALSRLAAIPGP